MTKRSTGQGADSWWYTDDQVAATTLTPGARWARRLRESLFLAASRHWGVGNAKGPYILLDAGCGDGVNLRFLEGLGSERFGAVRLIGMDLWTARLQKARFLSYDLLQGDLGSIPLRTESIHVVLLSHVLEHVDDPRRVLDELRRITKPGGSIVIAVPNEGCLLARMRNHVLQRHILKNTDHVHFFTASSLTVLASEVGLGRPTFVGHEGFFFPHLGAARRLRDSRWGRWTERALCKALPSQAAGLVAVFPRDPVHDSARLAP